MQISLDFRDASKPKRGDVRADGKVYWDTTRGYQIWKTPAQYERAKELRANSKRRWDQANASHVRNYASNRNKQCPARRARLNESWRKRNPEKKAASWISRRWNIQASRQDQPSIGHIYKARARISKCLGITFHVDHIIPLAKGGKHVIENLQLLPARLNLKKSDKILTSHA